MKNNLQYEFLLWIILSICLFVFVLPLGVSFLLKIFIGYVFYLLLVFIKELFLQHFGQTINVNHRINVLMDRIKHLPHKTRVYIHDHLDRVKKERVDISQYL